MIFQLVCTSLRSFSISEVGQSCWAISPGSQLVFQFILKVLNVVEVRALFVHTKL